MHVCMHACMYVWQQRKTICLLSIRISLACARASKLTTTSMHVCMIASHTGRPIPVLLSVGWIHAQHKDELSSSNVYLGPPIALSVCQLAFRLLDWVLKTTGSNSGRAIGRQFVSIELQIVFLRPYIICVETTDTCKYICIQLCVGV